MAKKKTPKQTHIIIWHSCNESVPVYDNKIEKELIYLYEEYYENEFNSVKDAVEQFIKDTEVYPCSSRIDFKLNVKQINVEFK